MRILARQVVAEPVAVVCANDSRLKFALRVLPVQRIHVPPREIQHIRITRIHQFLNRLNFRIHQLFALCKGRRCLRHNLRLNILGVRLIEEGLVVVVAVFHFRIIPERQAIRFSIEHEVSRLSEMLHKGRMREIPLPINLNHIHGIAVKIRNKHRALITNALAFNDALRVKVDIIGNICRIQQCFVCKCPAPARTFTLDKHHFAAICVRQHV